MDATAKPAVRQMIRHLQRDATDEKEPVSVLLRRALVLAREMGDRQGESWIRKELDGYSGPAKEMPDYRKVRGDPCAWNPARGSWIPVQFESPQEAEIMSSRRCGQSIAEIERLASDRRYSKTPLHMPVPPEMQAELNRNSTFGIATRFTLFIPGTGLDKILAAVRTRLIDWTLQFTTQTASNEEEMPFKDMMTDSLSVTRGGKVLCKIKGRVHPGGGTITTFETKTPIQEGDVIMRHLPNGAEERFEVVEPGFNSGLHSIPDSYQAQVRKVTDRPRPVPMVPHAITIQGDNARVNLHSTDHSINTVSKSVNVEFWAELNAAIQKIQEPARTQLANGAAAMKKAHGKPGFGAAWASFMANAANHVTALGPLFPQLASMFTGGGS